MQKFVGWNMGYVIIQNISMFHENKSFTFQQIGVAIFFDSLVTMNHVIPVLVPLNWHYIQGGYHLNTSDSGLHRLGEISRVVPIEGWYRNKSHT